MKHLTRRVEHPAGPQHPPEDWPGGAFNPESDFFVPEDLRAYYRVDANREGHLFSIGNSEARNVSSELHPLDHDIVSPALTAEALTRAGFHPRDHRDPMVHREFLRREAAKITDRDRQLHLHRWRLQEAANAKVAAQQRQERVAERRVELTCQVCGEYHKLTREARFARADDPTGRATSVLKATVCPACMQLVREAINDESARQITASGKTRREAASDLVRATLNGGATS